MHQPRKQLIEQTLELFTAANRIGDRHAQALALRGHQLPRFALRQLRCVQTDAAAANRRVGTPAESQVEIDRFFQAGQRIARQAQHVRAPRLVTHDDHVGLAAM